MSSALTARRVEHVPVSPLPHQVVALTDLARAHAVHDRTQLISACGTGKTLTARWHAQAAGARTVAFFAPSLALVAQSLGEWRRAHDLAWQFEAVVICSDPSTAAGALERAGEPDVDRLFWARAAASVTTSPVMAAAALRRALSHGRAVVVFSTYHSARVTAQAARTNEVTFDLLVCDEAHHLAGQPRDAFRAVLDDTRLAARKRLFMTATPTIVDGDVSLSMDDEALFGPVAHDVTFASAIDAGLLADYQVLVIAERAKHHQAVTVPAALIDAASRHHLRSVLSFHNFNAQAAEFAKAVDQVRLSNGRRLLARPVTGRHNARHRADALAWLAQPTHGSELRLVASARCLTEGVDVPAVDGIVFADPRRSVVSIIQAVGRALRPAPGKRKATIIVPVTIPDGADDDSELTVSKFAHVWAVLRALRAHDERLAAELDAAARAYYKSNGKTRTRLDRVRFLLPADFDDLPVQVRLVEMTASTWERSYGLLCAWAAENGGKFMPWGTQVGGVRVGAWAEKQRQVHRTGLMPEARVRALEQVPGWAWDRESGYWAENLRVLALLGDLTQRPDGPSVYAGTMDAWNHPIGHWAAVQRQLHRDGLLDPGRAAQLEAHPGWDWSGYLPDEDVAMVQALRVFCEFTKSADVPEAHKENGLDLGRWVWAVRRRSLTGRLHPALAEEIEAATPRGPKGEPTFQWEVLETRWRLGYSALRAFAGREGHAVIPVKHDEVFPDTTVSLYQWCSLQRFRYRRGTLDGKYAAWLEAVPGWAWEAPGRGGGAFAEPLVFDDQTLHGRPGGWARGCRCEDCTLDHRATTDRHQVAQRRARIEPPGGVSAAAATAHMAVLEAAGCKRGLICEVTSVPLGVIRLVAKGELVTIDPKYAAALLAATPAEINAAATRVGSRGRMTSRGGERIDATRTRALVADLAKRGLGPTWVARELGYAKGNFELTGKRVTRRVAELVEDLYDRAAGLSYYGGYNTTPPTLDQLREASG